MDHEVGDDAVELAVLEMKLLAGFTGSLLAGTQHTEVLRGPGNYVGKQLKLNATNDIAADLDVEEDARIGGGALRVRHDVLG